MQVYDKDENVVMAKTGPLAELLKEKEKLLKADPNIKIKIGQMPQKGDRFTIGDLLFVVTNVRSKGRIIAELEGGKV